MSQQWFVITDSADVVHVELVPGPHRYWPSEVLHEQPLPTELFRDRRVQVSGPSSGWFYAHVAAAAMAAGAIDVLAIAAGPDGLSSDLTSSRIEIWDGGGDASRFIVDMSIDNSNPLSREAMAQLIGPAKSQIADRNPTEVCLTGLAPNLLYAEMAAHCVKLGAERISWFSPSGGMIDIYFRDPQKAAGLLEPPIFPDDWRAKLTLKNPGRWIGVMGDPNVGKSLFSSTLDHHRRAMNVQGWRLDCDGQAPTPPWFLESTARGDVATAIQRRLDGKRNWTPEMEKFIAGQMKRMRQSLPVSIADLPGGDHRPSPPLRIPPGREQLFYPLDAIVIIEREDNPSEIEWRAALNPHGMEPAIAAVITSKSPQHPPTLSGEVRDGVWRGVAIGLDRSHLPSIIQEAMKPAINELWQHLMQFQRPDELPNYLRLMQAARAALSQSFLTKEGGTRYGAAVLSNSGQIFTSGQYSSWNHVTNVHAEQAALVIATMSGQSDIVALAVASTSAEPVARPCGVCRQVMVEHAARIHHDFDVLMGYRSNDRFELRRVSELLPQSWNANSRGDQHPATASDARLRRGPLISGNKPVGPLALGDHVVLSDGSVAMVWEPEFENDADGQLRALLKIKYAPPTNGERKKLSHSFTEAFLYERELRELGWAKPTTIGVSAATVRLDDVIEHLPSLPLDAIETSPPIELLEWIKQVGISVDAVRVTGSRSIGLSRQQSDWDLVVHASPDQVAGFRQLLFAALQQGKLAIPTTSGTWDLLDRLFPGGTTAIVKQQRFIDTVAIDGQSVALIFASASTHPIVSPRDNDSEPHVAGGYQAFYGTVTHATCAAFKRAEFTLQDGEDRPLRVTCFHKAGNLIQVGDRVALRGWMVPHSDERHLVQILYPRDNIVWIA